MSAPGTPAARDRLDGLDLARYLAFVGMVIVNFKIAMEAEAGTGALMTLTAALEGRAAATFVVLAGIGLGLAGAAGLDRTIAVTVRRAAFLLLVGLLNMLIFDADILHYYAFYFLFGALLMSLRTWGLVLAILGLNLTFVVMVLALDYDAGWDWETYTYAGFWTPGGFVRNLFFNGWHPVIPWLSFLLFGLILARMPLGERRVQAWLIGLGAAGFVLAEALAAGLAPVFTAIDPELAELATTEPVPPMPFYILAGLGMASFVTGLCLRIGPALDRIGVLGLVAPAGRQTLTLYIAHILVGVGVLEAMGLLGGQSIQSSVAASLLFCLVATVYAWLWSRAFTRGPVEALMRRTAG